MPGKLTCWCTAGSPKIGAESEDSKQDGCSSSTKVVIHYLLGLLYSHKSIIYGDGRRFISLEAKKHVFQCCAVSVVRQNVERQNVERQNVERQNVEWTKRRRDKT